MFNGNDASGCSRDGRPAGSLNMSAMAAARRRGRRGLRYARRGGAAVTMHDSSGRDTTYAIVGVGARASRTIESSVAPETFHLLMLGLVVLGVFGLTNPLLVMADVDDFITAKPY